MISLNVSAKLKILRKKQFLFDIYENGIVFGKNVGGQGSKPRPPTVV